MKIKRVIKWVIFNALFIAALWFGFEQGVGGARYVSVFVVWLGLAASLGALNDEIAAKMRETGPSVPSSISWALELAVCMFLVWHGSWVLGSAYILSSLLMYAAYERKDSGVTA